jgi:Xaa-Pro aminopeptidase
MLTEPVRRARLAEHLPPDVDALLVTDLCNVRYLTGFTGSNAAVLVLRDGRSVFATDGRYVTQAAREVPDLDTVEIRNVAPGLALRAAEESVKQLGIEADHVSVSGLHRLEEQAQGVALVPLAGLVEGMRAVKDDGEIAALRTACAITDVALAAAISHFRVGVTERDIAFALWSAMREAGAEALAFDTIVAFGPHSAIPHHRPTDRSLVAGDLIKVDCGARYGGYHADMTRTMVLGTPQAWQVELHEAVATVQADCREATRPGASAAGLGSLAQERIEGTGHALVHGLGHGVGLQVHEDPYLMPTSTAGALVEAMCVTVEPGIYLPGAGGVRIEDTVVVRADGNEVLTTSPRELLQV